MKTAITNQRAAPGFMLILLLLSPFLTSSPADYVPGTGIASSPHDFSGFQAGNAQTGACTFCHTPHRSSKTKLLWNHTLPNTAYTWSDYTVTGGGTPLPTIQSNWEGPTKFCLSCHDGSVAIGDIGWFNGRSWTGASALSATKVTIGVPNPFSISQFVFSMIGNHPVAAPYPYQGVRNTYNGVTTGSGVKLSDFNPDPTSLGIRLFKNPAGQQVLAGPSAGITGMECTSCHGVHNEQGIVVDKPLLRGMNGGAAGNICLKCHPNC